MRRDPSGQWLATASGSLVTVSNNRPHPGMFLHGA